MANTGRGPTDNAGRRGAGPPGQPPTDALRTTLAALRAGALSFSVLGGLACYILLVEVFRAPTLVAVLVGFAFALLTRVAAYSLGRDWLIGQAARRQSSRSPDDPAPRKGR